MCQLVQGQWAEEHSLSIENYVVERMQIAFGLRKALPQ
jgi:hypothetical protein